MLVCVCVCECGVRERNKRGGGRERERERECVRACVCLRQHIITLDETDRTESLILWFTPITKGYMVIRWDQSVQSGGRLMIQLC